MGATSSSPDHTITGILGSRLDPQWHDRLHHMEHHGGIDLVRLDTRDLSRRRLRVTSESGADCMIALARDEPLFDGAVLFADEAHAIVLKVNLERWLRLRPTSAEDALALGYAAGNLHWRVRFRGKDLEVAMEGPEQGYLDRIPDLIESGAVIVVAEETSSA
ncbi:urease accessory protein UreE [Jiella marina]|uniref:urease accessory protein UreE n=1 Tax=Jiella sp. LLJ827 TaxID=2917712 RepID=UPI002100694E|nr:urease accessory protein UreE [Jiella sp. LLJ827]MCQ0988051.1 urease accessory protein UreE [Jiella sp. LLJ827]